MLIDSDPTAGDGGNGEEEAEKRRRAEERKEKYDFFEGRMHGSSGSREGAVRGLAALSPQAVVRGLVESAGAKIIGEEASSDDTGEVLAVLVFSSFSLLFDRLILR